MQQNVGIGVVLTSDTKDARKGIQDVSNDLGGLANAAQKASDDTGAAFQGLGTAAKNLSGRFVLLNKAWDDLRKSSGTLGVTLRNNQLIMSRTTSEFERNSKVVGNANGALSGFSNIIRDAPFGIIGVGNNITQLSDSFVILKQQTGSTSAALGAMFSSIFSPAGLFSIGLSSAITLWTIYAQRQQKAASETKKVAEAIHDLASAFLEGSQNAVKETAQLDNLYKAATNVTIPMATRNSIVKELQREYPSYFGNLSQEEILTGKAATAYDKLRTSLIAVAKSRAIQDAVTKNQSDLLELEQQRAALASQRLTAIAKIQKVEQDIGRINLGGAEDATTVLQRTARANDALALLNKEVQDNESKQATLQKRNEELSKANEELIKTYGAAGAGIEELTKKQVKNGKTVADVLKELENELIAIDVLAKNGVGFLDTTNEERIKSYQKALQGLIDVGLKPTSTEVKKVTDRLDTLSKAIIGDNTVKSIPILISTGKGFTDTTKQVQRVGTGIENANKAWSQFKANVAATNLGLKTENFRKDLENFANISAQLTKSLKADLLAGFAEGLGGLALGTEKMGGLLGNLLSIVGDFAISLGKAAIPIGIAAEAIRNAFSSPQGAIAAGVGLIAVGGLIKAFASKLKGGVSSFAQGGIVSGAQLAVVGDNPGKKEAIIPSELWGKLGGGGNMVVAEIGYNALLIKLKQADRLNSR